MSLKSVKCLMDVKANSDREGMLQTLGHITFPPEHEAEGNNPLQTIYNVLIIYYMQNAKEMDTK